MQQRMDTSSGSQKSMRFSGEASNGKPAFNSSLLTAVKQLDNSALFETSVERGYTSSRLSRIKSDRKTNLASSPGKLRFNSVDSSDPSDGMAAGAMDINLRTIREVPEEYD